MRKISLLSGLLISFAALFAIGGCATATPDMDADKMIKDGMAKLVDVTSFTYEVTMQGDVKDEYSGDTKFDMKMNGAIDVKDTEDPKLALNLAGILDAGADGKGTVDAEFMLDKTAMYAKLSKLDFEGMDEMPAEVKEMFGKWYMVTLPAGSLDEFTATLPGSAEEDLSPEQKQMKEAFEQSKVFGDPVFVGTENVMGDSSFKYAVKVDKDGLAEFLQKVAVIQGEKMSSSDVAEMKAGLNNMDIEGHVWISVKSGIMNKFAGTITIQPGQDGSSGTIVLSSAMGKINEPVTLNIPSDAEEFPTELLFGAMMMGTMSDPAMMDMDYDAEMMDMEGMEDFDFEGMEGMEDLDLSEFEDMEDFDPSMFEL